ncbi:N5,N10-methylenetetrahydromethanopterin reductase [Staphylococcus saccharolyticus]|uniref:N5,N10-methylenetetrahydromethanopterin reductase n=1 Tax=Staphylococcus saccharolyticus TaxID=33028 RepID=A0A380GY72_9STAP|nr:LLM class flavin-dependent oxidoreductase [Staphylococcus saccharolyticus]SUM67745.1 N5,N10-methylenetetrahydromethanopterin reductase [Staphylococcus saccharolyticus]
MKIELGLTLFAENSTIYMPDGKRQPISHAQRIRDIIEEIELADQLWLDFYGLNEHHRKDYAVSDPVTVLSAAATRTHHIKLSSEQ